MQNHLTERKDYPGLIGKKFQPFSPIKLAERTETIVGNGNKRRYTHFYCTGVYGGISTGYTVGCCLRCVYCWVDMNRDFPFDSGKYYTHSEAFENLASNAHKAKVKNLRISGAEPTLCREHLLQLLGLVNKTKYTFILETNGILLGNDETYIKALKKFKNVHIRVSLKAGSPMGFEERTGAQKKFFQLPFQAIQYLQKHKLRFHVACMSDERLMSTEERKELLKHLKTIGYTDFLEEERCDPYDTTLIRLEKAGFHLFN
jgi:uncharacterized Fe-S cluster-containing radical SAM superfamily protein